MKYFVSADIHGFFDEWQTALKEKHFDINNPNHKILLLGDMFDRGRQPKEIIKYILKNREKIILIRGNHEDLMQEMIKRNCSDGADLHNGTSQTIVDLYPNWLITEDNLQKIANETGLQEILDTCIDYFETKKYIFVHGWIPVIPYCDEYDKDWRSANKRRWNDARWINPVEMFKNKIFEPGKTIVCGHWHCSAFWKAAFPNKYEEFGDKANFEPFISKEVIAIDACTAYSKKVNVIVIED